MAADPRDYVEPTLIGTPLRDAAVSPLAVDFLARTNAGAEYELDNRRGPNVISPGLHDDVSVRLLATGQVGAAPDPQEATEMASLIAAQPTADTPEGP